MTLSDSRLKRADYQHILDKLIAKLAGWKIGWITLVGRIVLVRVVLSTIPTFQMLAMAHPKWLHKMIDKIRRAFIWSGQGTTTAGKCLVRWSTICRPKSFGGLGIINLELHGYALRLRWLWQQHSQVDKPWQGLPIPTDSVTSCIFRASTKICIGNGMATLFWHDHWFQGTPLKLLFPALFKHSRGSRLLVGEALANNRWIGCIKPLPSTSVFTEYLHLADMLHATVLTPDTQDSIVWRWTANGKYSARSAYSFLCQTFISSNFPMLIWNTKTPPKQQVFAYLAIQNRCLTADMLRKKSIAHNPICAMCRILPETAVHLLAECSMARQVWTQVLLKYDARAAAPTATELSLEDWWWKSTMNLSRADATKVNCIVMATWATNALSICDLIHADLREWRDAGLGGAQWMPPD
ncbi:unnamed protein product [Alopecurus aequalis]